MAVAMKVCYPRPVFTPTATLITAFGATGLLIKKQGEESRSQFSVLPRVLFIRTGKELTVDIKEDQVTLCFPFYVLRLLCSRVLLLPEPRPSVHMQVFWHHQL